MSPASAAAVHHLDLTVSAEPDAKPHVRTRIWLWGLAAPVLVFTLVAAVASAFLAKSVAGVFGTFFMIWVFGAALCSRALWLYVAYAGVWTVTFPIARRRPAFVVASLIASLVAAAMMYSSLPAMCDQLKIGF